MNFVYGQKIKILPSTNSKKQRIKSVIVLGIKSGVLRYLGKIIGPHSHVVPIFNYKLYTECWCAQTSFSMEHEIRLESSLYGEYLAFQLTYLEDELRDQLLREAYLNNLSQI